MNYPSQYVSRFSLIGALLCFLPLLLFSKIFSVGALKHATGEKITILVTPTHPGFPFQGSIQKTTLKDLEEEDLHQRFGKKKSGAAQSFKHFDNWQLLSPEISYLPLHNKSQNLPLFIWYHSWKSHLV